MHPAAFAVVLSLALAQATPESTDEWKKIDTQGQELGTAVQKGDRDAVTKLVPPMKKRLDDFTVKYPKDPNAPKARLFSLQMELLMQEVGLPDAPTIKAVAAQYGQIVADASTPPDVRSEAAARQAALLLQTAIQSKSATDWEAAEGDIDATVKAHPEVTAGLRQEEVGAEKMGADPARFDALLTKLAKDPNPQVATLVTQAQEAQKQLAELRSKPLDIKFTAVDGRAVDLASMRGKVVLIDFWATWCGPCRGETPNVVATYKKYHDQGFEIVGISLDQDKNALTKYTAENGMAWPQYFDGLGWQNSISSRFGIQSIPAMWLVGKDGLLVTQEGRDDLDGQVGKLLGPK